MTTKKTSSSAIDLAAPCGAEAALDSADSSEPAWRDGPVTILLVDDEAPVRDLVAALLADAGYQVLAVDSGAAALELLARTPGTLDVLVTDVAMPSMTGPTLASKVREQLPGVAVVFMSGYLADEHFDGPARFLEKPFEIPDLLGTIQEAVDDARDAG